MKSLTTTYDEILLQWDSNVDFFLLWIDKICGHSPTSSIFKTLSKELKTKNDIRLWANYFNGDFDSIERTTLNFLKDRRTVQSVMK